jgi:hypothetical protein
MELLDRLILAAQVAQTLVVVVVEWEFHSGTADQADLVL